VDARSRRAAHLNVERARARKVRSLSHVTLVSGPPCSGKSTFVAERKRPGDVVVDYDALAVALGSPDSHDHPDELRVFVLTARDAVVAELSSRPGCRVWVIKGQPSQADLVMASEHVVLDVPADVCRARAVAAGRPERWLGLIDEWWAHFGELPSS
jgi:hypothetical protein